jgi:outer membrane protein OmpA-like peptidoglycan-associated protein
MLQRLLLIILLWSAWGCESSSLNHRITDATQSEDPKPTLTSFSNPKTGESLDLKERIIVPEVTAAKEGMAHDTTEAEPFPTIYFPFNSWEITPEVRESLDATAKWMILFSRYGLTIEGHTDIRGSESYNMVLGIRRAKAVKDYLANLGIPRTRLDMVSYGNTLVLCDVDDERRCHRFNRRADLLLE